MISAGFVLDASAVIALLQEEPGSSRVAETLTDAVIATVNLCEVVTKLQDLGFADLDVDQLLAEAGIRSIDFDAAQAIVAGRLRSATRSAGLSLGDRACIALGLQLGAVVLTADKAWAQLDLGVEIEQIR